MNTLKRYLPDVLAVLLFAVISYAYFFPADIEGRILYRHDSSAGRGAGQEVHPPIGEDGRDKPLCTGIYAYISFHNNLISEGSGRKPATLGRNLT